ncbi:hypothetical protein FF38_06571 [Lucilia cuprina]|uniref:Uncharacterized protein n=1 Tax=Lucilia cuprina TaxID=7375 RepID=A0A0L0CAX8_LUCCU|nr:hypothetical protein FF38_06571 [Lucilia cuprina]
MIGLVRDLKISRNNKTVWKSYGVNAMKLLLPQEQLYCVVTGNYKYRLMSRCRQDARGKFAKLRTDILEKNGTVIM